MIKRTLGMIIMLGFIAMMFAQATGLFFSEYVEGTSSNKAIEIFNGTGATVDLTPYSVKLGGNGLEWSTTLALTGTLANNDVFVIANPSANATILGLADVTSEVTFFNGDDCLGLFQGETLIDIIGVYLTDPGTAWDVAGTVGATLNHTLIRKPDVISGNTNWILGAGTTIDNSEWLVHPIDYITDLGMHTFDPGGGNNAATPTFDPPAGVFSSPVNVSISSTTPGAQIRYTTNGSEPTETSTLYTAPVAVSATTTIKARAYATGMDPSFVATATYLFPVMISNIAALRAAAADGTTVYHLSGQVILTFQQAWRHQKFIQDATGAILIDDSPGVITTTYNIGDGITGITGTLSRYTTGMLQFWPIVNTPPASSTGNVITPQVVTLSTITANLEQYQSKLVQINDVHFSSPSGNYAAQTSYDLLDATGTTIFRTQFSDADYIGTPMHTGTFDIYVIVTEYNTAAQVTARMLTDFTPGGATQVGTPYFTPPAGVYTQPISVVIACTTPGATIRYTTNGTDPTPTSTLYTVPIDLSADTTLKARGYATDLDPSAIATASYTFAAQQPHLFISEYVEGGSNNKAFEIFNGTGSPVDLSLYTAKLASNGGPWSTTNSVTLSGTLADRDVFVIAHSSASAEIQAVADLLHGVANFNGDDCIGLFFGDVLVDIIGVYQTDPGTGWPVAGVADATLNHTLIRKPTITEGNLDWIAGAGTTVDNSEWLVQPQDYIANLGMHTYNPGGQQAATPTFNPPAGAYAQPVSVTISTTTPSATIRYTTNGSDPTATSTIYTAPLAISTGTTLKAIAFATGMDPSPIATAVYTFPVMVSNIAALRAANPDGTTVYHLTGEVILTFQQSFRHQKYIQDATGAILIDDQPGVITTPYNIGDGITGITGTLSRYTTQMLQFWPTMNAPAASSTGNNIPVPVVTIGEINNNLEMFQSRLVRINNVHFDNPTGNYASGQSYNLTDNTGTMVFRTQFYDADYIGTPMHTGTFNLRGIVIQFNTTSQITARMLSDFNPPVANDDEVVVPATTQLIGNYPNPFNPNTTIRFSLEKAAPAQVTIFNQKGQVVKTYELPAAEKGLNNISWNGKDNNGQSVANGVYFFRLKSGSFTSTKKMVMMK